MLFRCRKPGLRSTLGLAIFLTLVSIVVSILHFNLRDRTFPPNYSDHPFCARVKLAGGLANRIRTIASYFAAAVYGGGGLVEFIWEPSPGCNSSFHQLFEPFEESYNVSIRLVESWSSIQNCLPPFSGQRTARVTFKDLFNLDRVVLPDGLKLYRIPSILFQPTKRIAETVGAFQGMVQWNSTRMVGLHVRRSDMDHHLKTVKKLGHRITSDNEFWRFVRAEIAVDNATRFFLATDNLQTRLNYTKEFGSKRILFVDALFDERPLTAGSPQRRTTVSHALVDLQLLARCEKMMGTYYSSYTQIAKFLLRGRKDLIRRRRSR